MLVYAAIEYSSSLATILFLPITSGNSRVASYDTYVAVDFRIIPIKSNLSQFVKWNLYRVESLSVFSKPTTNLNYFWWRWWGSNPRVATLSHIKLYYNFTKSIYAFFAQFKSKSSLYSSTITISSSNLGKSLISISPMSYDSVT